MPTSLHPDESHLQSWHPLADSKNQSLLWGLENHEEFWHVPAPDGASEVIDYMRQCGAEFLDGDDGAIYSAFPEFNKSLWADSQGAADDTRPLRDKFVPRRS